MGINNVDDHGCFWLMSWLNYWYAWYDSDDLFLDSMVCILLIIRLIENVLVCSTL
jgi:hypothetical protein